MFYLTRFLVELLAPFNLFYLLLVLALALLLLRRIRSGIAALVLGILLLIVFGYDFGIRDIIASRENTFPPLVGEKLQSLTTENIGYVVVLGSGHVSDNRLPVTSQIGGASLFRLIEGIRIHRLFPESKLLFTGGAGYDTVPNADIVAEVAQVLGVKSDSIVIRREAQDTNHEALAARGLVGSQPFVLVTSALHMTRAVQIFRDFGMTPIPAPTNFIIKKGTDNTPAGIFPQTANLDLWKRIIYEWMGMLWINGQRIIRKFQ